MSDELWDVSSLAMLHKHTWGTRIWQRSQQRKLLHSVLDNMIMESKAHPHLHSIPIVPRESSVSLVLNIIGESNRISPQVSMLSAAGLQCDPIRSSWCDKNTPRCGYRPRALYTVLAESNCVGHDGTSYAALKRVEVEFWCGTCRCDTGTQCWVHRVHVNAAHFGAIITKFLSR